jgi:hypothetical protein
VTVGDVSCAVADDADGGPPTLEKSGGALRRTSMVPTVMRLRGAWFCRIRRVRQGRSRRGGTVGSVLVVKRGAPSAEAESEDLPCLLIHGNQVW